MSFAQGISYALLKHKRDILGASAPCQSAGPAVMPVEILGVRPRSSLSAQEAWSTACGAGGLFLRYLPSEESSRDKLSSRLQTLWDEQEGLLWNSNSAAT